LEKTKMTALIIPSASNPETGRDRAQHQLGNARQQVGERQSVYEG
jgi:hypothetical protein